MFSDSEIFRRLSGIWLSLLVALVAGCASAPESVQISDVEEIAATVIAIDQSRRLVTVRGPRGNDLTLEVGPEVRNLAQVRVGDILRLSYEQAFIATRLDTDEMSPSVPITVGAVRAEPGERPGAGVGVMVTMTVKVESVGPDGATITYSEPDGRLQAIYVRREESRAFARSLRPGDIVEMTFAEALVIAVEQLGE